MIHHHIRRGETLAALAKKYGTTAKVIRDANPRVVISGGVARFASTDEIVAGDVYVIPVAEEPPAEEPPAEEPPAEEPPAEEPPAEEPPAEEPPAEEPPAEEPPAEEPPAEEPPAEEPPAEEPPPPPPTSDRFIWADVSKLPDNAAAQRVVTVANSSWGIANVSDQDNTHDAKTFAGSLVAAWKPTPAMIDKVTQACAAAIGTEAGGRTLALARQLTGYVLAADYIGYRDQKFVDWVDRVRTTNLEGRTLVSTQEDRPNNWGTHAGAARIAADLYLGDKTDLAKAVQVFRGYLGDRDAWRESVRGADGKMTPGFSYGSDLTWQADKTKPVGINPKGATIYGYDVDGVMPDDQRRTGSFAWPAPKGSYPWEAMQGVVTAATLLARNGYPDVWDWSDGAIGRAYAWLVNVNANPAQGDDLFIVPLIDYAFGTASWKGIAVNHGKSIGWTDWTHGYATR